MGWKDAAARAALIAAFVGGASYMAAWPLHLDHPVMTAWKGSGVALLAVYAALRARSLDGWLIALVMALGAAGDVLLEVIGLTRGALAFLAGHLVAIGLYVKNRRPGLGPTDWLVAAALVVATVATAWALPADRAMAPGIALYATGLSCMAASAWLSRFPRGWVALGAVMFLVSDLLIFARSGPLAGQAWVGIGVWTLYFGGQAMIALGVTRALSEPRPA
ncbi:lysoplasmalogenase [Phenylobacterium soli]|uniref:Lysoplasmalogenase n=1 Tax=Phenylobacterium soli TaxID=2170551 RepID=A0A328ANY7_9CAUL|nr:lysoplasmalogenase [Phenylobacterium soli]RAK56287.1 lysoplasmalogenase [Phenylobacterium soli]